MFKSMPRRCLLKSYEPRITPIFFSYEERAKAETEHPNTCTARRTSTRFERASLNTLTWMRLPALLSLGIKAQMLVGFGILLFTQEVCYINFTGDIKCMSKDKCNYFHTVYPNL
jgi:hypothetical protein